MDHGRPGEPGRGEAAWRGTVCPDCGGTMERRPPGQFVRMECAACGNTQRIENLSGAAAHRQREQLHPRGLERFQAAIRKGG